MGNVEVLRERMERATEDPDAFFALLHPDVEWDVSDTVSPMAGVYHGREAVREFYRRWAGAFSEWGYEIERMVEHGDHVVTFVREYGRGRGSGAEGEMHRAQLWTFRDGKVIRYRSFARLDAALAAAGLDPGA